MIRFVFLIHFCLWILVKSEFYLYNTRDLFQDNYLAFDCLLVTYRRQHIKSFSIEFCLRPANRSDYEWNQDFVLPVYQVYTFEELSAMNMTSYDLLPWSTSMDLVEEYQEYLESGNETLGSKKLYRCTKGWFGPRCQYSFELTGIGTINSLVSDTVRRKLIEADKHDEVFSTCFIHLPCRSDGVPVCLDWYQICDGKIDCPDGANDEIHCLSLEINECKDHEYRCHNGLCIDEKFLGGDEDLVYECLDRSDFLGDLDVHNTFDDVPLMFWREYGCGNDEEEFSRNGFRCVQDSTLYINGQNFVVAPLLNAQSFLSVDCWMVMTCLTKVFDQVHGRSCEDFLASTNVHQSIMTCPETSFPFPTKLILLGHIRLFFSRDALLTRWTSSEALAPHYACYNAKLCPHLQGSLFNDNLTCLNAMTLGFYADTSYYTWKSIISAIKSKFLGCLTRLTPINETKSSSLYCCPNSSKCISKHRIVDGIVDCPYGDDEEAFELSCSVKNRFRFRCSNESQCRSPLFSRDVCPKSYTIGLDDISFHEICNRIVQTTPQLIDGRYYTDETECEYWSCNNIHTRCNHFWDCPLGEDEYNCTGNTIECPNQTLECVSVLNYTIICLPAANVFDGIVDCLGGPDELTICRQNGTFVFDNPAFLCLNSSECIHNVDMCDRKRHCPLNDDEQFCDGQRERGICDQYSNSSFSTKTNAVGQALCRIAKWRKIYFSFKNLPTYPRVLSPNRLRIYAKPSKTVVNSAIVSTKGNVDARIWRCHYGLSAVTQLSLNKTAYQCFCPPNFYGDLCQYQSERVSVSLKVSSIGRGLVRGFIISLVTDDNDHEEVHSFHQDIYLLDDICGKTFQFFLLYSTRPKNISIQYSVRIEAFDKINLHYLATWYFPIPFLFLPVYPMAVSIYLPTEPLPLPRRCPLSCVRGHCRKYVNIDKFFCRCDHGWNGARCQYSIPCHQCSRDSKCVGVMRNRPICACPINTYGRRCLLKYDCPNDICDNDAQCLVTDQNQHYEGYGCICKEEYFSVVCNSKKNKLHMTFQDIPIPSFVAVYIYYDKTVIIGRFRKPLLTLLATKLRMFQTSVTVMTDKVMQIVVVQTSNKKYYLAVLQALSQPTDISTSISPAQECPHINQLMPLSLAQLPPIRRVKQYHKICRDHSKLMCFLDEAYLCLCATDRDASCLLFKGDFKCEDSTFCLNQGQCFQDRETCPMSTFCICSDCFFGDRCQFYAKGIGLTLDDMLRYEIRPHLSFHDQPTSVKVSVALVVIMFCAGLINSILSIITFFQRKSRQVGAGIYLLTSSITSLGTVSMLNAKFWFLIITQIQPTNVSIDSLRVGCIVIEPLLKFCLYFDSWLNGCVATERAMTVFSGNHFNKKRSKKISIGIIICMPFIIGGSFIHEVVYRELFEDKEEQRHWCSLRYSSSIVTYSTFILSFHIFVPFAANLLSAIYIIWHSVRRRTRMSNHGTYREHLLEQIKEYRYLIISPCVLVILSLPRVIISTLSGCVKQYRNPWLYLSGYFISFIPAVTVFLIFVLPSPLYMEQFRNATRRFRPNVLLSRSRRR